MNIQTITHHDPFVVALAQAIVTNRHPLRELFSGDHEALAFARNTGALASVANICLWTSVAKDEARPISGALCLASPSEVSDKRELMTHLPLTVEHLKRSMIASPSSPIGVHLVEGVPKIWGMIDIPLANPTQLRVAAVGRVIGSVNRDVIAIIDGDERQTSSISNEWRFRTIVARAIEHTHPFPKGMPVADRLRMIVAAISEHNHGGTLVVVPDTTGSWRSDVRFVYELNAESSQVVRRRVQALEAAAEASNDMYSNLYFAKEGGAFAANEAALLSRYEVQTRKDLLNALLKSIGQLSAVDGAVVVDEHLNVLGFGAKLSGPTVDFDVEKLDPLSNRHETVPVARLGGTRHQSAARFVDAHHTAMAFVASQDGNLTLFAWLDADRRVIAVRNLQYLI